MTYLGFPQGNFTFGSKRNRREVKWGRTTPSTQAAKSIAAFFAADNVER